MCRGLLAGVIGLGICFCLAGLLGAAPARAAGNLPLTVEQTRRAIKGLMLRYTPRHPDVVRLRRHLQRLEAERARRKRAKPLESGHVKSTGRVAPTVSRKTSRPAPRRPAPGAARPKKPRAAGPSRAERNRERAVLTKALAAEGVKLP